MKAIVATKYGPPDVLQLREVEKPTSNNPLPVPGREQGDATVSTKRSPVHQDTMMAIVQDTYGSPDVLELRDIDRPEIGDDQVLVRVHAAGVNPADWAIVGGLPYIARPVYGLRKPKNAVRGTDVAGTVEAVGAGVTRFQPGDEVFGWCGGLGGAFAEYAAVSEDALALKPANLTFEQAAAVPMAGLVALQALRDHGGVRAGQEVLINGASGGIGTFAVQIAKALGAEVTGVCSTRNVEMVRSIGADHVIDYTQEDFTRKDRRYDLILDNVANHSLSELRRALTPTGTLVPNGGGFDNRWFANGGRVVGAHVLGRFVGHRLRPFLVSPKVEDLVVLKELIEAGKVTPVIDRTYSLSETPEAVGRVGGGHARGKIAVTV
jgi:NADPH:quinone reductase-like Zn-dependent oxidoreductase